jgi:hypothetical protein
MSHYVFCTNQFTYLLNRKPTCKPNQDKQENVGSVPADIISELTPTYVE